MPCQTIDKLKYKFEPKSYFRTIGMPSYRKLARKQRRSEYNRYGDNHLLITPFVSFIVVAYKPDKWSMSAVVVVLVRWILRGSQRLITHMTQRVFVFSPSIYFTYHCLSIFLGSPRYSLLFDIAKSVQNSVNISGEGVSFKCLLRGNLMCEEYSCCTL